MAYFAAPNLGYLVRIVNRKLKKIRHRPHLITMPGLLVDG
jgi:hypothetical protein